ncbi:MAG: hypothetical protein AB4057_12465 [Crocosphaera sp.]
MRTEEIANKNYNIVSFWNSIFIPGSLIYMKRISNFLKICFFYFILVLAMPPISIEINYLLELIVTCFCVLLNFIEQLFSISQARKRLKYCKQVLKTEQYKQLDDGTWLGTIKDFEDIKVKGININECRKELEKALQHEIFSQLYYGTLILKYEDN